MRMKPRKRRDARWLDERIAHHREMILIGRYGREAPWVWVRDSTKYVVTVQGTQAGNQSEENRGSKDTCTKDANETEVVYDTSNHYLLAIIYSFIRY